MAGNATPDPTTEAVLTVLREEAVSSPNLDSDTLAKRIADGLPASKAASSDASAALDRANDRIAQLTAQLTAHGVEPEAEANTSPSDGNADGSPVTGANTAAAQ